MVKAGIIELDMHGKNVYQARVAVDAALRRSAGAVRLRVIHGSSRGTAIRDMLWHDYGENPKVLRLIGINGDITDLVLREL